MEDIRVMRKTQSQTHQFAASGAVQLLVPFDANRVSLDFSGGSAAQIFRLALGPNTAENQGYQVGSLNGDLHLDIMRNGAIVKGPLYVTATGAMSIYWTESILNEQ